MKKHGILKLIASAISKSDILKKCSNNVIAKESYYDSLTNLVEFKKKKNKK